MEASSQQKENKGVVSMEPTFRLQCDRLSKNHNLPLAEVRYSKEYNFSPPCLGHFLSLTPKILFTALICWFKIWMIPGKWEKLDAYLEYLITIKSSLII